MVTSLLSRLLIIAASRGSARDIITAAAAVAIRQKRIVPQQALGGQVPVSAPTKVEITEEAPQVRAVVGGTGDYFAARGQVTTVRHKDGSYDHTIELAK